MPRTDQADAAPAQTPPLAEVMAPPGTPPIPLSIGGGTPETLPHCLGWHIAIQPGPTPLAPLDRLPEMLWSTSTLRPVLILPPSAAKDYPVGMPSATREPSWQAWRQAATLIIERSRQKPMRREPFSPPAPAAKTGPDGAASAEAARGLPTPRYPDAEPRRQNLTQREKPLDPNGRSATSTSRAVGTSPPTITGNETTPANKNPVQREGAPTPPAHRPASAPLSAMRMASAPAIRPAPMTAGSSRMTKAEDLMRREHHPAEHPEPPACGHVSHACITSIPAGTPDKPGAKDLMRRENTRLRTGPLRNGNPRGNPNLAPRCGARTRRGCPCRGPAMTNGRCRMHGGASTGPRTPEGLARLRAARTSHAPHVAEALAFDRTCRQLIQRANALLSLAKAKAAERQAVDAQTLLPSPAPPPAHKPRQPKHPIRREPPGPMRMPRAHKHANQRHRLSAPIDSHGSAPPVEPHQHETIRPNIRSGPNR